MNSLPGSAGFSLLRDVLGRLKPALPGLLLALLGLLFAALAAAEPAPIPPIAPAGQAELHGTVGGQRFWARLLPADPQFAGNRVLRLVYTPPAPAELGGVVLGDSPLLLVDDRLRLVAWNGRDTLNQVRRQKTAYTVVREVHPDGERGAPAEDRRTIAGEPAWELRLSGILLALCWTPGSRGEERLVDAFGPRHGESLTIRWTDREATIAGRAFRIESAGQRLKRLAPVAPPEDAAAVVEVAGWLSPEPPPP
ncbi:hypothetical protein LBMAG53_30670 [Planctomycetota bacterium]|nr:hypothetical protein LBMAG53_30670 [Planctomycetota bacterium]